MENRETNKQKHLRLKSEIIAILRANPTVSREGLAIQLGVRENHVFGAAFTAARDELVTTGSVDLKPIVGTGAYAVATPEQMLKRSKRYAIKGKKALTRSVTRAEAAAAGLTDPKLIASARRVARESEYRASRSASAPARTQAGSIKPVRKFKGPK